MRRLLALLAALVVLPGVVLIQDSGGPSATEQWFLAADSEGMSTGATTQFFSVGGRRDKALTNGAAPHGVVFPTAGTISDWRVDLSADVGTAGDDATVTLQVDTTGTGTATDSALSCTVSGGAGTEDTCTDGDTLAVSAGDRVLGKIVTAGSPDGARPWVRFKFTPTTTNTVVWGSHVTAPNAGVRYALPLGSYVNATETDNGHVMAAAGAITGLACVGDSDLTGTQSYTLTFMVNGAAQTDVSAVFDDTHQEFSDTGSITIAAGDRVSIRSTPANTPTDNVEISCGLTFVPTTSGQVPYAVFSSSGSNPFGTQYGELMDGDGVSPIDTEGWTDQPSPAFVVDHIYVNRNAAPSSGKSWVHTLRESAADAATTCTVADAATTCEGATDTTVELNNPIDIAVTGVSNPNNGIVRIGVRVKP